MERLLNNNNSSSSSHKAPKDVVSSNSKNKNPSSWEPIDDILLRHLKEIKKMGWKEISQYFTNRTPNACQFRWRRLKSGNLKSNKTALMDVTIFPGEIKILNPSNIDKKSSKDNHNSTNTKLASSSTSQPHSEKKNETIKLPVINNTSQQLMPPPPSTTTTSTTTTVQLAPLKFTQNKVTFNSNRRNSSISNNIIHNNTSTNHSPTGQSTFSPRGSFSINHPSMDIDSQTNDILIENETVKDFVKPRSYSHTLTSHAMTPVNSTNGNLEVENVGFIPKVFVKSRRSSFIVPPTSPMSLTQSINNALNTTLTTSKSRKNSFVHYQRRYSLAAVSSTSSSRRSSIIVAPNSMSTTFNNYQLPTSKQRRESIIRTHKNGTGNNNIKHSSVPTTNLDVPTNNANTHLFNHNYSFTDMPTSTSNKAATSATTTTTTTTTATTRNDSTHWSVQEDKLLLENKYRNLSLPELSILLPNKSESDIDLRLTSLRANSNVTSQANENAVESSSSSNSPTPQLQLPEYVSPIHSPTRSLILNQSDSIINSQEYKDHLELGTKRSGTAESQASSSSKGGISPSEFSQTSPDNDTASSISSVSMNAGHNNNNNTMKSQDYSTLLRSARQTSNDHSSLPHHHDSIEQTNTHQMHHHQMPPHQMHHHQMHHQAPQQQMPHQTPHQTHQQLPQQLPSINTIFQGI